jgi:hypothetical protein
MDEPHRRMLVSPAGLTRFVSIAIPAEIQTRAGADLQDAQRKPRAMRHLQEASQEGGAPSHLVGLAPTRHQLADLLAILAQRVPKRRPRSAGIAVAAD